MFKCNKLKLDMEIQECVRRQNRRMIRVVGDISPSYLECKGCNQGRKNLGLNLHPKRRTDLIVCEYCKLPKERGDFETIAGKRNIYCKECEELLILKSEYKQRRRAMSVEVEKKEEISELVKKGHSINYIAKLTKTGIVRVKEIRSELYSDLEKQGFDLPKCGCGNNANHKGRCEFRRKEENHSITGKNNMNSEPENEKVVDSNKGVNIPIRYSVQKAVDDIVKEVQVKLSEISDLCTTLRILQKYGANVVVPSLDLEDLLEGKPNS